MDAYGLDCQIIETLGHEPTTGQKTTARELVRFIYSKSANQLKPLFILKGYAGTGKTTLVSALVKSLPLTGVKTVLLAPTGRAAKVLGNYSGNQALTIHKKIYVQHILKNGAVSVSLKQNLHKSTLFIVDEASMIQNTTNPEGDELFARRNLLSDLMDFVYSSNCRLLLVGDTAQLPPVGMSISPALDQEYLLSAFPVVIHLAELTEVVRQELDSGILFNATNLRIRLAINDFTLPFFQVGNQQDVIKIDGSLFEELLNESIHRVGIESSVVITRSNKRANLFNRAIRNRILFRDSEIAAGDLMMGVRNNYHWLSPDSQAGFIANGEMIEILRVKKQEKLYGFRFADVSIRLIDYPDEPELELKILLDTLESETPALSKEDNKRLFEEVLLDYEHIPDRNKKLAEVRNNEWLNALQVKFAYALTCHKTQGGQWTEVFIDQGYINDEMINQEYLRWLYTALTRATKRVYMVNFKEEFFGL